jgi:hypothetical protein
VVRTAAERRCLHLWLLLTCLTAKRLIFNIICALHFTLCDILLLHGSPTSNLDHDRPLSSSFLSLRRGSYEGESLAAMSHKLPFSLALAFFAALQTAALPSFSDDAFGFRSRLVPLVPWETRTVEKRQDSGNFETNNNGSKFLWLIQDTYAGQTFFE